MTQQFKIRFSDILRELHQCSDDSFICFAASRVVSRSSIKPVWTCSVTSENTYNELKRIMPGFIREYSDPYSSSHTTLNDWAKNLPSHLRTLRNNGDIGLFRIKFLKWAIKKFGDQELTFTV